MKFCTPSEAALIIATKAHAGQTRNDKVTPYTEHPKAVMQIAEELTGIHWTPYERELVQVIAALHDVNEDHPEWTLSIIIEEIEVIYGPLTSFERTHIKDALYLLNKNNHPNYLAMILAIKQNPIARVVKIADIKHNMSDSPSKSNLKVYQLALYILEN